MILRILSFLFPQVRLLIMERDNARSMEQHAHMSCMNWQARHDSAAENLVYLRSRLERAEALTAKVQHELQDILMTASDSLALRATGRRLFSKAPVEAPPEHQEPRAPINLSTGAGRPFAGDVARKNNADFFRRVAKQAGVAPVEQEDQKPN